MYIVSACLLGEKCKYNGEDNFTQWVHDLMKNHMLCMVCPETLAKLGTPRVPAEIKDGKVINKDGIDVTKAFEEGARIAYTKAAVAARSIGEEIEGAILKSNSPSCGRDKVYDGNFTGTLVDGEGIFARVLKEHGIKIITEKEKIDG